MEGKEQATGQAQNDQLAGQPIPVDSDVIDFASMRNKATGRVPSAATFCGSDDQYPATSYVPKSIPWSSAQVLAGLDRSQVALSTADLGEFKDVLWNDLRSEYDAENFCDYLKRQDAGFSAEFKAFEHVWRRDEFNHYVGFRMLYCMLYDEDEALVEARLRSVPADFKPISHLLADEFVTTLLLAYDEIATTKSYAADHAFYKSWGPDAFHRWIKLVTRDESYHFNNLMRLVEAKHPERIPEIPEHVERFIEWDLNGSEYRGTFVLDHDGHYFNEEFLRDCGNAMNHFFDRRKSD